MKNNKFTINITLIILVIILVIIRIKYDEETVKFFADACSLGLFGILLQRVLDYIYECNPKLFFQSIIYWNKPIRVSFAYLFRIKIDGLYFLVKGNKVQKFQPVGGVYQYYESAKSDIDGIFISSDKMKEHSSDNQNDIRGYVKGKNLIKFISWFESRKNREINCNREFIEELIATSILDVETFKHLEYRFIGTYHDGIFKTDRKGYEHEYVIAEIYELILNNKQKIKFQKLKNIFDKETEIDKLSYTFATKNEIESKRLNKTNYSNHTDNITNHSFKILEEVEDELQ